VTTVDFSLRVARHADMNALSALAMQVWLHTYATDGVSPVIADYVLGALSSARFAELVADPATRIVVAEHGYNLLGFATVRRNMPCPSEALAQVELQTLYVQAHFIGKGVGSALLRHVAHWAQAQTGSALWLKVNAQNQRAIDFYLAHGYRQQGTTLFMLGGVGHENHVMAGP
jgi:diamine N-acetyltransferase